MKISQQNYDSCDYSNVYKKVKETFFHKQKLEEIKHRKRQFIETTGYSKHHEASPKKNTNDFGNLNLFKIDRDNKILAQKIDRIIRKEPTPFQLNDMFIKKEVQNKMNAGVIKKLKQEEIDQSNLDLFKRIKQKTSFISAKELDSKFSHEHKNLVNKMRKVKKLESVDYLKQTLILPNIHSSRIKTEPATQKSI